MRGFLIIITTFSWFISSAQNDSIRNSWAVGIYPLNAFSAFQNVFFVQHGCKKVTWELGGGVYNLMKSPYSNVTEGTYGYTVQGGAMFFFDRKVSMTGRNGVVYTRAVSGGFFKVYGFYRYVNYANRSYVRNTDGIAETRTFGSYIFNGGSDYENETNQIANEIKHVVALQANVGEMLFLDEQEHFFFNYYCGLGGRIKYRVLHVTHGHTTSSSHLSPIDPPVKTTITTILPSMHLGIQFGFSF